MTTSYFTFGQCHCHRIANMTVDCDTVIKITANDPRKVMVDTFGLKWAMEYSERPDMRFYPNGILRLDEHGNPDFS